VLKRPSKTSAIRVRVYRFGHRESYFHAVSTPRSLRSLSPAQFEELGNLYLAQGEQLQAGSGGGQPHENSVGEPT